MGLYATTTSIPQIYPGFLSGSTVTSDTAGVDSFSKAIDRAESIVNAYVVARYDLPMSVVPPLLRTLAEDMACYYVTRAAYTQDGQNRNQYLNDWKLAKETLEEIKDGKVKLTLTDGSLVPGISSSRMLSTTRDFSPVFNLDDPQNWKPDSGKLDEINSGRD